MVSQLDRSAKAFTTVTADPRNASHAWTWFRSPATTPLMPPGTRPPPEMAGARWAGGFAVLAGFGLGDGEGDGDGLGLGDGETDGVVRVAGCRPPRAAASTRSEPPSPPEPGEIAKPRAAAARERTPTEANHTGR
jgi:hypothetical protein